MTKYNSRPIEYDGIRFDSIAEYRRYGELKLLEQAGEITCLEVHPRFLLQQAFTYNHTRERAITYEADFAYYEKDGRRVIEDCKGVRTEAYKIKRKLFLARYPEVKFVEVEA